MSFKNIFGAIALALGPTRALVQHSGGESDAVDAAIVLLRDAEHDFEAIIADAVDKRVADAISEGLSAFANRTQDVVTDLHERLADVETKIGTEPPAAPGDLLPGGTDQNDGDALLPPDDVTIPTDTIDEPPTPPASPMTDPAGVPGTENLNDPDTVVANAPREGDLADVAPTVTVQVPGTPASGGTVTSGAETAGDPSQAPHVTVAAAAVPEHGAGLDDLGVTGTTDEPDVLVTGAGVDPGTTGEEAVLGAVDDTVEGDGDDEQDEDDTLTPA